MKTIVILEGASTSGKTTVMTMLFDALKGRGVECLMHEQQKTVPADVFSNPDPKRSVRETGTFLREECAEDNAVHLCDRLHLSQMAITKGSLEDLSEIERELSFCNPLLVFLEIPEETMKERLVGAKAFRTEQWDEELARRGTEDEAVAWFTHTQRNLFALYEESTLPKVLFDTGTLGYDEITARLVQRLVEEPWEEPVTDSELPLAGD